MHSANVTVNVHRRQSWQYSGIYTCLRVDKTIMGRESTTRSERPCNIVHKKGREDMNDDYVRALNGFVQLHASKLASAASSNERCAYLVPYRATGIPLEIDVHDFRCTREDVLRKFDSSSPPIRWLLQQIGSYDQTDSHVIGLIFDNRTAFAHVVRKGTRM